MSVSRWLSVQRVAAVSGLSESTIRRRIRSGRVPTRTGEDGAVEVDAQALARLSHGATNSAKPASTSAASGGGGGDGGGGAATPRDGQLAARVFERLESGSRPVDLVAELEAPPATIAALVQAWRDLRGGEGDTLADRVAALEAQVATLGATLAAVARSVPPTDVRCSGCGQAHTLGTMLACTRCGTQGVWPPVPAPAAAS